MLQCESALCVASQYVAVRFELKGENLSDSVWTVANSIREAAVDRGVGQFGDKRLARNGELIVERVSQRQTVCIRNLADDRAEQARFQRFLSNDAVTIEEMISHRAMFVAAAAKGRHVLAIEPRM